MAGEVAVVVGPLTDNAVFSHRRGKALATAPVFCDDSFE